MKILCVAPRPDGTLGITPGVDSAVLRPGEPVFVDEPLAERRSAIAPAVRLSRLGMCIKRSNARAYYDSVSAMHLLTPAPGSSLEAEMPPYLDDRSFSPGKWHGIEGIASDAAFEISAVRGPIGDTAVPEEYSATFSIDSLRVDEAIELISKHMTFKTGDILVFPAAGISLGIPMLDSSVSAEINNLPTLSIRIK